MSMTTGTVTIVEKREDFGIRSQHGGANWQKENLRQSSGRSGSESVVRLAPFSSGAPETGETAKTRTGLAPAGEQ